MKHALSLAPLCKNMAMCKSLINSAANDGYIHISGGLYIVSSIDKEWYIFWPSQHFHYTSEYVN